MKKLLSIALVLALLLSLGASAFAEEAQFQATRTFLADLDTLEGFHYELGEVRTEDGTRYEPIYLTYDGGEFSDYVSHMSVVFSEDSEEVQLFLFNLINFDEEDYADVLVAVNAINAEGSGVKLYVDDSDNSVTSEMYLLTTEASCEEIALEGLGFLISYTDIAYETLAEYSID